jgi:hypothetical protein
MKARTILLGCLACLAAAGFSGCQRNIVRAAPPSVAASPTPEPQPQPEPEPTVVAPPDAPAPSEPLPVPALGAAAPAAPRPRPASPAEAAKPKEPEAPQISPQLSPAELSDAQRRTTSDISVAERNLQMASGRTLNASQKDLAEKVRGFLEQAHSAIRASDWVRALNLAQKAQVLSTELIKSL